VLSGLNGTLKEKQVKEFVNRKDKERKRKEKKKGT